MHRMSLVAPSPPSTNPASHTLTTHLTMFPPRENSINRISISIPNQSPPTIYSRDQSRYIRPHMAHEPLLIFPNLHVLLYRPTPYQNGFQLQHPRYVLFPTHSRCLTNRSSQDKVILCLSCPRITFVQKTVWVLCLGSVEATELRSKPPPWLLYLPLWNPWGRLWNEICLFFCITIFVVQFFHLLIYH